MARLIDRSAFLYMDPISSDPLFAQCATCRFWMPNQFCALFATAPTVKATATCGLYVYGTPSNQQPRVACTVWPSEAGLEDRPVRCENCHWFRPEQQACHLFVRLNIDNPTVFNLDIKVHPRGCCNANTPRE